MQENGLQNSQQTEAGGMRHASPSLMKKLRLPLIIGGSALGAIVLLLVGIWIGTAKRNADMKQYEERAVAAKKQLDISLSEQKVLEAKLEGLSGSLSGQKEREESKNLLITVLQEKLNCFEQAAVQALAAEEAAKLGGDKKPTMKAKIESEPKGYVRFGNSSCTLVAGGSSNGWKDCLKQGKSTGSAEKAKASGAAQASAKH